MDQEIPEIKPDPQQQEPSKDLPNLLMEKKPLRLPKIPKGVPIVLALLLIVAVFLALVIGLPLYRAYTDGQVAYQMALGIKDAAKSQDIKKVDEAITRTKNQFVKVRQDLKPLSWTTRLPFIGGYTSDAIHLAAAGQSGLEAAEILVKAVEPYSDLLGLKGQGSFTGGTAEERIAKAVETLDKVTPQIDLIAQKMADIRTNVDTVDPNRYPESFRGKPIRSRIVEVKSIVDLSGSLLTQAQPMVKKLPLLLGSNSEQKYLILFQNDKELRPTGGFITAYAVFKVNKGKISLDNADDIYKLDDTVTMHVTPPDQISTYLNVYGWRLRDANFSPDFVSSMKTFEDLYNSSREKKDIAGIITVDTHVLISMMNVLGPIPAYGTNFTTQKVAGCDCPMVIYELEKYADQPTNYERGNRKDIIGVLLSELLKKALSSPRQIYGSLFQVGIDEANQKHVLFFLHDPDAQKGIEALGFAGRVKTTPGDFLHINDANLGGAKANLYIVQSVKKEVTINSKGADTNLTIEYRYPHPADNCSLERKEGLCLAGIYRDYLRIYLPAGAQVAEARGFENRSRTFSDLGHTVVDGFFTVVPQGLAKIQVKYSVPGDFQSKGTYDLFVQKQPGTDANKYSLSVNGQSSQFELLADKELSVKL